MKLLIPAIILLGLLGPAGFTLGCAEVMPAISSGLDGARGVIKTACPERTKPCEDMQTAFNAATFSYNAALLAEAVHKDSSALANSALGYLDAVLTALQNVEAPPDEFAKPKPSQ